MSEAIVPKYEPYNSTWRERPHEKQRGAVNFYALSSVDKLQTQLEKEQELGVELRKKIMALRRGKAPVMVTAQHQHYFRENTGNTHDDLQKVAEQIVRPF